MAGMALATVFSCYAELLVLLSHFTNKTSLLKPSPCLGLQKEWAMALSNGVPVMLHELTAFCKRQQIRWLGRSGEQDMGGSYLRRVYGRPGHSSLSYVLPA